MADVKQISDATFPTDVLQSDRPVLVDFWAPWCGPCRAVAPVLDEVARQYDGRVTVAKLNVDENQQTAGAYGIRSIPAIALFVGGEVVDGVLGAAPATYFQEMLDKHLEPATAGES